MNLKYAKRSEDTEQIKLINWCRINESRYPELRWCFHIPNGGKRNKQEAEKLKQMGVKAGVADIQLPFSKGIYNGMFIELKYEDNKPTKNQIEFLQAMQAAGLDPKTWNVGHVDSIYMTLISKKSGRKKVIFI